MKTGIKALMVLTIIVGALATSVFALPAFTDAITERDPSHNRIRSRIQICDSDGECNCTYAYQNRQGNYTYAYQHRQGNCTNCPGQGHRMQLHSRAQFCGSNQNRERLLNRFGFGRTP